VNYDVPSYKLGALAEGVYRCYPCFRTSEEGPWTPCTGTDLLYLKLTVSGETMQVENVLPFQWTLQSVTGGKTEYLPGEVIMVTPNIKVEAGELHETLFSFIVPVDETGGLVMDSPSVVGPQACYYSKDQTFDFPISCQVLQEGKYALCIASSSTETFLRVWDFVITNTPSGIKTITSAKTATAAPSYNLSGQRVTDSYRGLVIQQGQKTIRK